jgi:hypothetical protein
LHRSFVSFSVSAKENNKNRKENTPAAADFQKESATTGEFFIYFKQF